MGGIPVNGGPGLNQTQMALQFQQQQQAAQNAHAGRQETIQQDATTLTPGARFQASLGRFGDSISALPPDQRQQVGDIHNRVQAEYKQAQADGRPYDPLAQFAGDTMRWAGQRLDGNALDQKVGAVFDYSAALIDAHRANQLAQQAGGR